MVRKLAVAAFALSALSSGVAQALGLGEATVQSSLNQPLTAEIELVNIRELEKNEILTGLADRDEFGRAGVERVFFLSDLRFRVEVNEDGNAVIKVTSSRPVREPFLNFLVEVNWPSGRLLREYALLIDPPAFGDGSAAPVQLASTPESQSDQAPSDIAAQETSDSQQSQVIPNAAPDPLTSTDLAELPQQTIAARAETYGPTRANDTMWSIALKTRPDSSISPQEMMLAIQDLNPEAFIADNVNQLKQDQVLNLPSEEQIKVRSAREAAAAFAAQTRQFEAEKSQSRISPSTELAASSAGKDQLRIVVDGGSGAAELSPESTGVQSGGKGDSSSADIALTREQLDLTRRENDDLKSRLEDLEGQLETMQRLVALKDDQLAALQGDSQDGLAEALPGSDESVSEDQQPLIDDSSLEAILEDLQSTDAVVGPEPASGEQELTETESSQITASTDENPGEGVGDLAVQETPPVSAFGKIVDNVKNNTLYQGALAGGGVLALLLLFLAARRKTTDDGPTADIEDASDMSAGSTDEDSSGNTVVIGKPGDQAVDGDASDPIAEAEVYIAYQKYNQAEQVLEDAVKQQPENFDYQFKLLEVLGESRKTVRFVAVLGALEASGDAAVLERASEIKARYPDLLGGSEVSLDDLESQLLAGDDAASDDDLAQSDISDDFELDVDMENSADIDDPVTRSEADVGFIEENQLDLSEEADVNADDDLDIEFDLSDLDLDDAEEDKAGEIASDIAFDEADLDLEDKRVSGRGDFASVGESLDSALSPADTLDDEFTDLDDFKGLGKDTEEADSSDSGEAAAEDISLDLDQEDLDFSLDDYSDLTKDDVAADQKNALDDTVNPEDTGVKLAEDVGISADKSAEDFASQLGSTPDDIAQSLPEGQLSAEKGMVADMDDDFDFLSDTDEAATKLDLARAYVDMGDSEGARDILEEVAEEGSDDQKQEAHELLKGLG